MRINLLQRTALLLTILLAFAAFTSAQETTGSISGTITDSSGAAIKGATVSLTNTDRSQIVRTVNTNGAGFFTATSLPLGTYTVKIANTGFKTEAVTGLVLHANDALTVNHSLNVGNVNEVVTVTADQVQLNLENGMSQGLINGTQIRELALNNRNYEQLLILQPGVSFGGANDQLYIGVSLPSGTSAQVAFSINGNRPTSNNWTIDGSDNVVGAGHHHRCPRQPYPASGRQVHLLNHSYLLSPRLRAWVFLCPRATRYHRIPHPPIDTPDTIKEGERKSCRAQMPQDLAPFRTQVQSPRSFPAPLPRS